MERARYALQQLQRQEYINTTKELYKKVITEICVKAAAITVRSISRI